MIVEFLLRYLQYFFLEEIFEQPFFQPLPFWFQFHHFFVLISSSQRTAAKFRIFSTTLIYKSVKMPVESKL